SDIYSFGITMWEILYGKPVPSERDSLKFMIQVCNGLRPHISENTSRCYADLMKKCWHTEPEKRPTAAEICDIFAEWHNKYIIHDDVKFEKFKKIQLKYNIEWIPFNRLFDIVTIGKGGFSTVYRAIWLDDYYADYDKHDVDYYNMHESSKIVAL
ncbi:kinase-like domain-containing protein, partial [Gigaspora rosea]